MHSMRWLHRGSTVCAIAWTTTTTWQARACTTPSTPYNRSSHTESTEAHAHTHNCTEESSATAKHAIQQQQMLREHATVNASHSSRNGDATTSFVSADKEQLERLHERVLTLDRCVRQHAQQLQVQARQATAVLHRIADVEDKLREAHLRLTEVNRVVGLVAMQQSNTDLLMQQLERRVISVLASASSSSSVTSQPTRDSAVIKDDCAASSRGKAVRAPCKGNASDQTNSSRASDLLSSKAVWTARRRRRRACVMDTIRRLIAEQQRKVVQETKQHAVHARTMHRSGAVKMGEEGQSCSGVHTHAESAQRDTTKEKPAEEHKHVHSLRQRLNNIEACVNSLPVQTDAHADYTHRTMDFTRGTPTDKVSDAPSASSTLLDGVQQNEKLTACVDASKTQNNICTTSVSTGVYGHTSGAEREDASAPCVANNTPAQTTPHDTCSSSCSSPLRSLYYFEDAAGVTRSCNEQIVIRNIPWNMGAAEVRELCCNYAVLCRAKGSGQEERNESLQQQQKHRTVPIVVSCVLRHIPKSVLAHSALATPCLEKDEDRVECRTNSSGMGNSEVAHKSKQSGCYTDDYAQQKQPLPWSDTERVFEVTFASAQDAWMAMTQLNQCTISVGHGQSPQRLIATQAYGRVCEEDRA